MFPDAYIEICEEPKSKWKRLRYESEGEMAPIEGLRTSRKKKTFPSLKIEGYTGYATIKVSTVTVDEPHRNHPHDLVGKNCEDGIYIIRDFYTDSNNPKKLQFPDLRIQRCLKKQIPLRLTKRESLNINPFDLSGYDDDNMQRDIHNLRLCFQVFIRPDPTNPTFEIQLPPQVSHPIANNNVAVEMKIHEISDLSSPASGGKKIIIVCNKIERKDIKIRFFEEDAEKRKTLIGDFEPDNVHGDVAIVFKTPAYDRILNKQSNIFIEMVRPSDNARSNRFAFQYVPNVTDIDDVMMRKQEKIKMSKNFYQYVSTISHNDFLSNVEQQKYSELQQPQYNQVRQCSPLQQCNMQPKNPPQLNLQQEYIPKGYPHMFNLVHKGSTPQKSIQLQHHNLPEQYIPYEQCIPQENVNPQEQDTEGQFNLLELENDPLHLFELCTSPLNENDYIDDDQLVLSANDNWKSVYNIAGPSPKNSN